MANITRIKNNQITDANVVAYAKMTPGTITGNLISSTLTMSSNVTIIGNLNVTGNTATINSVNTYIQDPIVVFNAGYVNSITNYDIGMLVNRNLNNLGPYGAVNTAWVWVENDQAFEGITTATTGNAITNLTNAGYANLKIGNVTAVGLVVNNNLTAGTITATPISGSTGYFTTLYGTNFSTANAQISGGAITSTPISGSTGYFTTAQATNFSSGNILVTGGTANGLTDFTAILAQATNFSTGNAVITGGYANGLANLYVTTAQATNFSSGNVFISGGYLTGISNVYATLGQFTNISSGNVLFTGGAITGLTNFTASQAQATNFSTGNAVVSGGYISALANATISTAVITNFSTGNAQITGGTFTGIAAGNFTTLQGTNFSSSNVLVTGGEIDNTVIGSILPSSAKFTSLTATGITTSYGNLAAASGTASTNTTSGALVVTGGAGVSGSVYAGSVYDNGTRVVSTSTGAGNLTISGTGISLTPIGNGPVNAGNALSIPTIVTDAYGRVVSVTANTISTSWGLQGTSGSFTVNDGTTLQLVGTYGVTISVGNEYANIATPQDLRSTASPTFAALNSTGAITSSSTITASGNIVAASGTASTNTTTGALVVVGGAGVSGDAYIGSTMTVTGSATLNSTLKVAGVATLNGNVVAASGTSSASTTTGALVVAGGAGVSGNVYVGGNIVTTGTSGNITGVNNITSTTGTFGNITTGNVVTTGAVGIAGDVSIAGNLKVTGTLTYINTTTEIVSGIEIVAGNLVANSGTASTSTTTGALVVAGGAGVSGAIYAGSIQNTPIGSTTPNSGAFTSLNATGTTTLQGNIASTITTPNDGLTTTTGALQIAGGAGIAGNLTVGGNITAQGNINIIANVNAVTLTSASGVFYGNAAGFGALYAGITTGYAVQPQTVIQASSNFNGYAQVNHQNINSGASASTDFVATANNGNLNDTYIDMGINSSGFVQSTQSLSYANDGYLYVQGNTTTGGGNLLLATGTNNNIYFATGGLNNNNLVMQITSGNVVQLVNNQSSTSTTTGALQVAGGVGIQGTLYAGGIQNTPIGSTTASTGAFTTLSSSTQATLATTVTTNFSTGNAVITGGYINNVANLSTTGTVVSGGNIVAASGTISTSTTTGALVVRGGLGVGSNIALGGNLILTNGIGSNGQVATATGTGVQWVTPLFYTIYNGTSNVNIATPGGSVTIGVNNANIATVSSSGVSVNGTIGFNGGYITDISGNTVIANSVGGSIILGDNGPGQATLTAGNLIANSGVAANGSVNNGALQVYGGALITGDVYGGSFNGPIGNHTISTGAFLSVTTSQTIVSSGNIVAGAGTPSTSSSTGGLVVVSGAGIGGNLNVSGMTTIAGNVNLQSNLSVQSSITSSSNLNISGISRLVGNTFIGGNLVLSNGTNTVSPTTGALVITGQGGASIGGNVYIEQSLYVGVESQNPDLVNALTVFRGTSGAGPGVQYTQASLLNTSNTGSADWIAYVDNYPGPSYDHGWVDMGIAGSAFNDPDFSITGPNDAYLFGSAAGSSFGGNLVLATDYSGYQNDIVMAVGSFYANAEVARFHGNVSNNGNFTIELTSNPAPSANASAFRVWGGESISGNSYVGGAMTINGSQGSGNNVIVKGYSDSSLIWARPSASYDQVLIGGSATTSTLTTGAKLQINSTDSMLLPIGTTGQRPGTPVTGMFRYNTTAGGIEWYTGSSWKLAQSAFTVISDQQFNGDGTTTAFTIASNQTTSSCIVSVNGIIQIPTLAYSVSNSILTFTEAPLSGDVIDVRQLTTTTTPVALYDISSYNTVTVSNTGVQITTGTSSANPVTGWDVTGARINNNANVTVSASGTSTIDSFYANTYSSAEYTITGTIAGTNIRQISKVLVVSTGSAASATTYANVVTSNTLATFGATVSSGQVNLQATATNANMIYRIDRLYQPI